MPESVELASPWAYWEDEPCLNGQFLVIKPSKKLFEERIKPWLKDEKIRSQNFREIYDMDIVNKEWEHREFLNVKDKCRILPEVLMLPSHYCVLYRDFTDLSFQEKLKSTHFKNGKKGLLETARVVHVKPWLGGQIGTIPELVEIWKESLEKICKEWDICI